MTKHNRNLEREVYRLKEENKRLYTENLKLRILLGHPVKDDLPKPDNSEILEYPEFDTDDEDLFIYKIDRRTINETDYSLRFRVDGLIYRDIPIVSLPISIRLRNALFRAKFTNISEVVKTKVSDLVKARSLGAKCFNELYAFIKETMVILYDTKDIFNELSVNKEYDDSYIKKATNILYNDINNSIDEIVPYDTIYVLLSNFREYINVDYDFDNILNDMRLLSTIYADESILTAIRNRMIQIAQTLLDGFTISDMADRLPKSFVLSHRIETLFEYLTVQNIFSVFNKRYYYNSISILDYVKGLDISDSKKRIIFERLSGLTLEEIAKEYDLSRERIRQIVLDNINDTKKPIVNENKYLYWYEKYNLSAEEFTTVFEEPIETYMYLKLVSEKGIYSLEAMLNDSFITLPIMKRIENYLQTNKEYAKKKEYEERIRDKRLLYAEPDIAEEWHPTKNGDLTPDKVLKTSKQRVWWRCPNGHDYEMTIVNRRQLKHRSLIDKNKGIACPYCDNREVLTNFNDLQTKYPDVAKEWHPTKNGTLRPEDVLFLTTQRVWWQDELGHEWEATVRDRTLLSAKCPYCKNKRLWVGFNDLASQYPEVAEEWHPYKNGDLKPSDVFKNSNKVVWWLGKCHHEWQSPVHNKVECRYSKTKGCPICNPPHRKNNKDDWSL